MPMQEVAAAAGFGSVRRFNDAFRSSYGRAPRELRRLGDRGRKTGAHAVQLSYRLPFDWGALLRFFAARATPGVESVREGRYLRSIKVDGEAGILEVRDAGGHLALALHGIGTNALFPVVQRVRSMLDLDAAVNDIARVLSRDGVLRSCVRNSPGFRLPGAWDGFELAVRAVLGQQVSVKAATTMAGRIAARYGERIDVAVDGIDALPERLFPPAAKLLRARLENLGVIRSRAQTIRELARAVVNGDIAFDASMDPAEVRTVLLSIRGVGDWTAEYIAMRALKDPDALPASDLGLLRAFDDGIGRRMKPAELVARAEAWRPWRAYAATLIWGSDAGAGG